jgi:hypothetical protein
VSVALVVALRKELVVGCASRVCRAIRSPRCCRRSRRDYLLYSIYNLGQLGMVVLGQTRMVMDHLRLSVKSSRMEVRMQILRTMWLRRLLRLIVPTGEQVADLGEVVFRDG